MESVDKLDTNKEFALSRSKVILAGILILALFWGGILITYLAHADFKVADQLAELLLAIIFTLIALGIIIWSCYHLFINKPLMVIDRRGIYTQRYGKIPWSDISNVSLAYYRYALPSISPTIIVNFNDDKVIKLSLQFSSLKPDSVIKILKTYQGTL